MDKRALFLVPVVMALLGLLLVWLGWVPGGAPGAPTDTLRPAAAGGVDGDADGHAEGAEPDAEASPDEPAPDERVPRRERVRAQPERHTGAIETSGDVSEAEFDDSELDPASTHTPRGYANAYVVRHRDEVHREKMKIVWPSLPPEDEPPAGAEILIIQGYDGYTATRVAWNGSRGAGARVAFRSRRRGGKRVTSHAFDVSYVTFRRVWHAARFINGARAEYKEPPPASNEIGGSTSMSSHAPHYWVRARADEGELHASMTRSRSFSQGIRSWNQIQNRALHDLFAGLVPEPATEAPLDNWRGPMTREIVTATPVEEPDAATRVLLLGVALPIVGESGDREALAAVVRMHEPLRARAVAGAGGAPSFYETQVREACELARAKIELRLDWSAESAVRSIRENPRQHRWQEDLAQWTRDRLREEDPSRYVEMLRADLSERHDDAPLMRETISELRRHYTGELGGLLAPALASKDPEVRVSTALGLLEAIPREALAIEALDAVAADTRLHAPTWQTFQKTPRARAVGRLIDDGHWDTTRMRQQFAAPGEDGRMLYRLELALAKAGDALSAVERRDAYRRAIEGRADRGLLTAMERLIELDDAPSFARIEALLTRYATPPDGEEDLLDRWARDRLIPKIREALAKARGL